MAYTPNSARDPATLGKLREQRREYQHRFRTKNPKHSAQRTAIYRQRHPERAKLSLQKSSRKSLYGLSDIDYNVMFAAQGGLCSICTEAPAIAVEHSHVTKAVRSLTCRQCNVMIGMAHERPDILRRGAEYLEKHGKD